MRNRKGFTLVEVMIVVAIIGLLAAIAIPNLLRARINANDGAAKGDLRAFSTAAESYRAANNSYPGNISLLTSGTPSYLDTTWSTGATKHGHTISYNAVDASNYELEASTINNNSSVIYCIDQTGVLRTGAASGSGCGGSVIT